MYRDGFVPSTEPDFNGTQLDVVSRYGYAVFESDDDISIAWGINPHAS